MKRINRSTWAMLALPSLIACTTSGGDDNLPTGKASFALSQTTGQGTFRFLGSIDIVGESGGVTDTLVATESSPASQLKELPGGAYSLDLVDGDFGEKLVGAETPACSYSGGLTGFIGCTVGDPGFFLVSPGVTGDVGIPVTFHFGEGDVQILFSTGNAVFTLDATIVTEGCGGECAAGEICAAVDGNVGCYASCFSDADCGGGDCTFVAEEGGGNAQLICMGGSGGECAHDQCEAGVALDPGVCGDCVANICAVDPFCCEVTWDDFCVSEVQSVCGLPCDGEECAHDQCEEGVALDPAVCGDCVANICAADPFCCESGWDAQCVSEVESICGATCGGGECAHDQCVEGEPLDPAVCGDCVANICAADPFCCESGWDAQCVSEVESICGATCGGGECAHDQCEEGVALDPAVCGECVANICAADPFCCESGWDAQCVSEVESICGATCGGGECAHDQCVEGEPLDPAVCGDCVANICAADPFCCETGWDAQCVSEVESICGATCGGGPECEHGLCEAGTPLVSTCDECVGSICAVDPFCCSSSWDGQCIAEVETICGSTECGGSAECTHGICELGDPLISTCDECVTSICAADPFCCNTNWDGQCVGEVETICGSTECTAPTECAHDTCVTGPPLDPVVCGECVAAICAADPFCCASQWDSTCVGEVGTICGGVCTTAPQLSPRDRALLE